MGGLHTDNTPSADSQRRGNIVLITQSLEGGTAKEPVASGLVGSAPWAGRCNVWAPQGLGSRGLEGARYVPSQNFLIRRAK